MIAPVGVDATDVVHRFRRQPRLFRPDDELAQERDDEPPRITGRSALTQVLVVFDSLHLVVGALLQGRLCGGGELRGDAARSRREEASTGRRHVGSDPESRPIGQLVERRRLTSAARRRHFQRGVELQSRTIFRPRRDHSPELVGRLRGTISLPGRGRGGCKNEQSGKGERGAACHCHKSLWIISYGRIRGPSQADLKGGLDVHQCRSVVSVEADFRSARRGGSKREIEMAKNGSVDRRDFLKSAAVTSAALVGGAAGVGAQTAPPAPAAAGPASAPVAPRETDPALEADIVTTDRPGGDFMVDVLKSLNFEYVAANPGSSFRGLHESIINYGSNTVPSSSPAATRNRPSRWRTATSRSKASRWRCWCTAPSACSTRRWRSTTPTAIACRSIMLPATRSTRRCDGPAWSGRTACRTRRRWCATSSSGTTCRGRLPHFAESAVRAYKIAMTPPMMPVLLVLDGGLQEDPISDGSEAAAAHPEADAHHAAAGRLGRGGRGRAAARHRAEPGDRRRSPGAHAGGHDASRSSSPRRCRRRSSIRAAA